MWGMCLVIIPGLIQGVVWCLIPCQPGIPLKKAVTSEGFCKSLFLDTILH